MHARTHIHAHNNIGEKVADLVVSGMGSWRFIIIQTIIVAAWIVGNLWLLSRPFDAFPFILLNLLFSTQAAYASPLILMAANRQSAKDRVRDDLEASEVADIFNNHQELLQLNRTQLEILSKQDEVLAQQSEILDYLKAQQPNPREVMLKENQELLKQVNALVRQIKALDKLKPEP